jgi:hypothetical protein
VSRAAKVDANQKAIVEVFRAAGASWQSLAMVGGGCPDGILGWRGITTLVEIKDGSKKPSERRLNAQQVAWHGAWRGGPVVVVESVDDALAILGVSS